VVRVRSEAIGGEDRRQKNDGEHRDDQSPDPGAADSGDQGRCADTGDDDERDEKQASSELGDGACLVAQGFSFGGSA